MILKNFSEAFGSGKISDFDAKKDYGTNVSTFTDINITSIWSIFSANQRNANNGSSFLYIGLGSGSTAPTYTDTGLVTPINNLTYVSSNFRCFTGKIFRYVDLTVCNDTESIINIKEIVFGANVYRAENTSNCGIALARKVFDKAVGVNPGETISISYSILLS